MNNNGRILLVVDDEPDITLAFSMGLEDSGFTVEALMIRYRHWNLSKKRRNHMLWHSLTLICQK